MTNKTVNQILAPVKKKITTRFAKPMPKQTTYKAEIMAFPMREATNDTCPYNT
jgi:hypothetical protein